MATYLLSIQETEHKKCCNCGRCTHNDLPGWPESHKAGGLLISSRMLEEKADAVDAAIKACPFEIINLNVATAKEKLQC